MFTDKEGKPCAVCGLPFGVWLHNGQPECRSPDNTELLHRFRRAVAAIKQGVVR